MLLVIAILGVVTGVSLMLGAASPANNPGIIYPGIILTAASGIYILIWARTKPKGTSSFAQAQPTAKASASTKPQSENEQEQLLPPLQSSGGVLFVPRPLDEQNRPDER